MYRFWSQSVGIRSVGVRCAVAGAMIAAVVAAPDTAAAQSALADTTVASDGPPPAQWYVVGDIGASRPAGIDRFAGFDDRLTAGDVDRGSTALGLTFSNAESDRVLHFTAPSSVPGDQAEDRFTFLVSGAYDWHTGTIVTPRFMAGVGVSYLDLDGTPTRLRPDRSPLGDLAPAAQVGIGAEVSISGALDLNAEYRASMRGNADTGRSDLEPQLDQKFTIGARLRF